MYSLTRSIPVIQISEQHLKILVPAPAGAPAAAPLCAAEDIHAISDFQISQRITELLKGFKVHAASVILSVPRNMATVRNLHLPSRDAAEIAQMVDLNVIRIVPYKREDVVFGYQVLGQDDAGYARVILAIAKIDFIRRLTGIVEKAGLVPERIVLGSYGVTQKVMDMDFDEAAADDLYVALDIDAGFTDLIVLSSDALLYTRSINIGARALAEHTAAASAKFISELRQFLMMFYNEEINKKPARVFLCGAVSGQPLARRVEQELEFPVTLAAEEGKAAREDVSFASLSGLQAGGAEGIDFMLPEIQVRKNLSQMTRDLVFLGGSCFYFLVTLCGLYWGHVYNQDNYSARLKAEAAGVEKALGVLPLQLQKVEFVKKCLEERRAPLFVMATLQKIVPSRVALTSVELDDKGAVTLRGQAADISDVFKFMDNLEKTPHLKGVQTRSTKKKMVRDRDLTEFELAFTLS